MKFGFIVFKASRVIQRGFVDKSTGESTVELFESSSLDSIERATIRIDWVLKDRLLNTLDFLEE